MGLVLARQLNFMISRRLLSRGIIGLIGIEAGLALTYLAVVLQNGRSTPLLDFNGLRSLPSLLQAAHLFTIGGLCVFLLLNRHRMAHPISSFLPTVLALLCFFGGLDEMFKIHLEFRQFNWEIIYLSLLLAIPILGWRDLQIIWRHYRSTVRWVLMGLAVFLVGGFGAEMLKEAIASEITARSSSTRLLFLVEHLRITIEEFAELFGETLILYAFARFALGTYRSSDRGVME